MMDLNIAMATIALPPLRPRSVEQWLARLPLADPCRCGASLMQLLAAMAEAPLAPADRCRLLQLCAVSLRQLLPSLGDRFWHQPHPLPQPSWMASQRLLQLLEYYTSGWRMLTQQPVAGWWQRRQRRHHQRLASHYLLASYEQLLESRRDAGFVDPHGLWRDACRLYLEAQQQQQAHHTHPDPLEQPQRNYSISDRFRRLLLLSLLAPGRVSPRQLMEIRATLPYWLTRLELREGSLKEALNDASICYVLLPDHDRPPLPPQLFINHPPTTRVLMLRCDAIAQELRALLQTPSTTTTAAPRLSQPSLRVLLHHWCEPPLRQQSRHPCHQSVSLLAGLDGVHHQLLAEQPVTTDATPVTAFGLVADGHWQDLSAHATAIEMDGAAHHYACDRAELLDRSEDGCRLQLPLNHRQQWRVGGVIAIRDTADSAWRCGTLRWSSEEPDQQRVQLGVQLLCEQCRPCWLQIDRPGVATARIAVIHGYDRQRRPILLLPPINGYQQAQLRLFHEGDMQGEAIQCRSALLESPLMEMGYIIASPDGDKP